MSPAENVRVAVVGATGAVGTTIHPDRVGGGEPGSLVGPPAVRLRNALAAASVVGLDRGKDPDDLCSRPCH